MAEEQLAVLTRGATGDEVVRHMLLSRLGDARRLAASILHDTPAAEDAVQQAALFAWDRRGGFRSEDDADGWLTRIVVNVCRDGLRRHARCPQLVALEDGPGGTWPGSQPAAPAGAMTAFPVGDAVLFGSGQSGVPDWLGTKAGR